MHHMTYTTEARQLFTNFFLKKNSAEMSEMSLGGNEQAGENLNC